MIGYLVADYYIENNNIEEIYKWRFGEIYYAGGKD
jgi:hypothetical protein